MARPSTSVVPPAGLLLTGGASRRMGEDKAALLLDGRSLAERAASLLTAAAHPVLEVGPGYTSLTCVREDPPGAGPLAALAAGATALAAATPVADPRSRPALVLATDLPHLTGALLDWLAHHPAPGCVVPLDVTGRAQPVCARYSPDALAVAPALVAAGHRSLMALLDRVPVTWVHAAEWEAAAGRPDALTDVDTADDLVWLSSPEARQVEP